MRLLMLEFFRGALRRDERSMFYPFLQGLARERGARTLWLGYGGDVAHRPGGPAGRTIHAAPPEGDLRSLAGRLERLRPTHVLVNNPLSPEARGVVDSAAPAARLLVMPQAGDMERRDDFSRCGWFLDWLGDPDPALARERLVERAIPDYAAVMANAAARSSPPHVTLVSGMLCANRRTTAGNPFFAGLAPETGAHRGCSFCKCATLPSLTAPGTDPLPLIETQLRRVRDTAGRRGRARGSFEFFDIRAFWRFDEVFDLVLRLGLPPSVFLFNPRIDDVLRRRAAIERTLPALAAAGHEVRILSMGAENFSEAENARFNKGIALEQVDEFLALTKAWEKAHGKVFKPFKAGRDEVELGFILFTPWTTLADVRLNLTRARERGFAPRGYWLYSVLLIEPAAPGERPTPILRLAERDGVLAGAFPDRGQLYGLTKNEGDMNGVLPWRFRDRKVSDYFSILVRICAADREGPSCDYFSRDSEYALALRLWREASAKWNISPLDVAFALLDVIEPPRAPCSRESLLRHAVDNAVKLAAARAPLASKRPAAPALSPRARSVSRILARLNQSPPRALSDVSFSPLEELAGPPRLRLSFSVSGRPLVVDLFDARTKGPAFLRSRSYRAVYRDDAPPPDERERAKLALLLRLLDAAA